MISSKTTIAGVSLFLAAVLGSFAHCVDPEPVVVSSPGRATPSAECLKCMATPDLPGPGCGDEIAKCFSAVTCHRSYDCSIEKGCIGGEVQQLVACLPACTIAAGFMSLDDPGRDYGLRVYECITRGACSSKCFTDVGDGGVLFSDAGTPPGDAVDAPTSDATDDVPIGDACLNPSDEAITSDMDNVSTQAQTCGLQCFAQADMDCAAKCMVKQLGLSDACAACWGGSIVCVSQNCLVECLRGKQDPSCLSCTDQHCNADFHACSGN